MTGDTSSQFWPGLEELLQNWRTFIDHRQISPRVEAHIARSWQRCYLRMNPLQNLGPTHLSTGLLNAADSSASIRTVGRRTMEDLYEHMEGTSSALLLVNRTGYIIEMLGDTDMLSELEKRGMRRGILFAESHMGTNAFALAVMDGIPVRVRGPEHFLKQYHDLAEAAAPLFDIGGRPLGAIGIINRLEQHGAHTLSLAVAAAQIVLDQRGSDLLLAEQNNQIDQMNAILGIVSEGMMVWNGEGRVLHINEAAEQLLNVPRKAIMGKHFRDFLSLPSWLEDAIQEREAVTNVSAHVRAGNHPLDLTVSVSFLQSRTEFHSAIVILRKNTNAPQISQNIPNLVAANLNEILPGSSMMVRRARGLARTATAARASVMIRGERGTGKNMLAAAIHNNGPRREEPFVVLGCAYIQPDQMVVDLLGFGDGVSEQEPWGRPGKLELAQGSTIYFQDVEKLTREAQAILLDILELGIVRHPDRRHPIAVDVRVIASSSADMEKLIRDGYFRSDLYYQLSTFEINLPSLRERIEDLPALTEEMLKSVSSQFNEPLHLTDEALEILKEYDWSGNLRELDAVLHLAASQAKGQVDITPDHLPDFVFNQVHKEKEGPMPLRISSLHEIQREAVIRSARQTHGNVTQMALRLGVSRTTVWRKLREFDITVDDFRDTNN
ncbi:MAG: sigma 54-interacting transcriptional regulator [Anaerolineae bacterium]|nr:sigma 54-interacting transcriptional regulator [Anaerolineae bacterium]